MLTHLVIRDFAIVKSLDLEFGPGMSAMTGETGAGKSILLEALGLLLGDRADSDAVRVGVERAEVCAGFDLSQRPEARQWLAGRDLEQDDHACQVRRVVNRQGRSRAYINGSPQPLQSLREFGELLVDIHGQHEHQSLMHRERQRELLDDYAGNEALLAEVAKRYREFHALEQRLEDLQRASEARDARLDMLRYQVQELLQLGLQDGELTALEEELPRLAHAEKLLAGTQLALNVLYENDEISGASLLGQAQSELEALVELDSRLAPTLELVKGALIQVQEASDELRSYTGSVDLDPARLAFVEERLAAVDRLARKHRVAGEELPGLLASLGAELDSIENRDEHLQSLEKQLAGARKAYQDSAARLGKHRREAADELAARVSETIQGLGMPKGEVKIAVEHAERPTVHGLDNVEFQVSANLGQPLRPLARVASGGELSRISLAIRVIAAGSQRIPTLVFDEVDTGIGGGVAEVVGRQLRSLGRHCQVLCVTHLPQVAAQAHCHFQIRKRSDEQSTWTTVTPLDEDQRVAEIARMLGGLSVTENTLAHAREMIELAGGLAAPKGG